MSEYTSPTLSEYATENSGVLVQIMWDISRLTDHCPTTSAVQSADGTPVLFDSPTPDGIMLQHYIEGHPIGRAQALEAADRKAAELVQVAAHDIGSFALRVGQVVRSDHLLSAASGNLDGVNDPTFRSLISGIVVTDPELLDALAGPPPSYTTASWKMADLYTPYGLLRATKTSLTYNGALPNATEYGLLRIGEDEEERFELSTTNGGAIGITYSKRDNTPLPGRHIVTNQSLYPDPTTLSRIADMTAI